MIIDQHADHEVMAWLLGALHGNVHQRAFTCNRRLLQSERHHTLLIFCAVPASTVDTSTYPFPESEPERVGTTAPICRPQH